MLSVKKYRGYRDVYTVHYTALGDIWEPAKWTNCQGWRLRFEVDPPKISRS